MRKFLLLILLLILGCANMNNPVIDDPDNPTLHFAKHLFYVDSNELLITEISNIKYAFRLANKDDWYWYEKK